VQGRAARGVRKKRGAEPPPDRREPDNEACWTNEHVSAKSTAIKGRDGKSGGRAEKAIDLTSGGHRAIIRSSEKRDSPMLMSSVIPSDARRPNSQAPSRKACEDTQ
jgi:hypothetical protein